MSLQTKYDIACAAEVARTNKQFKALKKLELEATCDKRACDLWVLGTGCTVGYCRRVDI